MSLQLIDLTVPGGDSLKDAMTKINSNSEDLSKWIKWGTGSPEGIMSGYVGALYLDTANGVMYQKVTGSATKTGWQSIAGTALTSAQHFATAKNIEVTTGTLTLTEDSNIFVVSGNSTLTSIAGWTQGICFIRWTESRTITHNSTSLILQNGQNRTVQAGDISIFEMSTTGAREINYFPANGYYNFKEYGLQLSHSGGNITVAAGQRYADDHTTQLVYAGGTFDVTGSTNSTMYYLWMGKNSDGTVVLEKDTNSDGSGLSTITGAKTLIGRYYYGVGAIDTTQLWTKHADGTETYEYTQASGNFPNADVTITHNLNTRNVDFEIFAFNSSNNTYPLGVFHTSIYGFHKAGFINSLNSLFLKKVTNYLIFNTSGTTTVENSASYKLKAVIKTRLA